MISLAQQNAGLFFRQPTPQNSIGSSATGILQRISTLDEHLSLLRLAFTEAKKTLLITSFAITQETLQTAGLYPLFHQARQRGVKIYCYYNDKKEVDEAIITTLECLGVFCDEAYTHSKIVAVDHSWVALGSFNWLSCIDDRYVSANEGSIVCRGEEICADLVEDLWEYLKYYRNRQFGNDRQIEQTEMNPDHESIPIYSLPRSSELGYLTTLDQHLGFFQEAFTKARHRIVICSPFISSAEAYQEDLDPKVLRELSAKGVEVFFVCSEESACLEKFNVFLNSTSSPATHLVPIQKFHLKTILIDDNLIAEGSFNWLSASRDSESDYHNHETTLFVEGEMARDLIQHFYASPVGLQVLNGIEKVRKARPTMQARSSWQQRPFRGQQSFRWS